MSFLHFVLPSSWVPSKVGSSSSSSAFLNFLAFICSVCRGANLGLIFVFIFTYLLPWYLEIIHLIILGFRT